MLYPGAGCECSLAVDVKPASLRGAFVHGEHHCVPSVARGSDGFERGSGGFWEAVAWGR